MDKMANKLKSFELKDQQYENPTIASQKYSTEEDDTQNTYEEIDNISIRQTKTGPAHSFFCRSAIESSNTTAAGVQESSSKQKECSVTKTTETILPQRVSSFEKWKVLSIIALIVIIALAVALVTVLIMTTASKGKSVNATCQSSDECLQFLRCTNNQCNCIDSEYWSGNGCSKRKSLNATCQSSDECLQFLRCTNKHCNCIDSEYWSGNGCSKRKSLNATCQSSDECLQFLRCTNKHCNCIDSEYWSGNGCSKRKSVNASCLSTDECSQPLMCTDHRCNAPRECAEITHVRNGVNSIWPNGVNAVLVYCIEGWTVIQRRYNGSVDFQRSWSEYKSGFGSPYGEYWLGNDNIHLISIRGTHKISILLNNDLIANYSTFNIGDEFSKYVLTVSGFSGNISDGLTVYNGMKFSTKDQDNDNITLNCATQYGAGGGWWYHHCFNSHLNFVYGHQFFRWTSVKTLTQSTMLIRNK